MLNGSIVIKDRRFVQIPEIEVMKAANSRAKRIRFPVGVEIAG